MGCKFIEERGKDIKTSSWKSGKYDLFFYGFVRGLKPRVCVELGTYAGFSAYWIAKALKHNGEGHLDCYDLWDDYEYNHVSINEAKNNLKGLPVTLNNENALEAHRKYSTTYVSLLNVDISNDGENCRTILENWYDHLDYNGVILLEGGSKERDEVDWMKKYNKKKIRGVLRDRQLNHLYKISVISFFPGITILEKK